jgi:aspartate racemase
VNDLFDQGEEAVILGYTKITLLINQNDTKVPLYDTNRIHAAKAVQFALFDDITI